MDTPTEIARRCTAAGYDDRLMDGQLYLDASITIMSLHEQNGHYARTIQDMNNEIDRLKKEIRLLRRWMGNTHFAGDESIFNVWQRRDKALYPDLQEE